MKIVCISDTHNHLRNIEVPDGDILIHAGDATIWGEEEEIDMFVEDFLDLPHQHKIFIPGNHDFGFFNDPNQQAKLSADVHFLMDSGVTIEGINFYGVPWQTDLSRWAGYLREDQLQEKWNLIPENTDVLITHVPPYRICDRLSDRALARNMFQEDPNIGSPSLRQKVINNKNIKFHVFGHIHEAYGTALIDEQSFINAACLNEFYKVANPPVIFYIEANKPL